MDANRKLHPRNATAQAATLAAGNPIITGLESGVGNCFPGLECDIRNLERRFFPHLTVDFGGPVVAFDGRYIVIVAVNIESARAAGLSPAELSAYETISADLAVPETPPWIVNTLEGHFGPFGRLTLPRENLGSANHPADAWTAVRLLPERQPVTLRLSRFQDPGGPTVTLTAPRVAYFDDHGALNPMFAVGEMTQSLCSPWTHDFRDCGCYYWASNHPDIAKPQRPFLGEEEPTAAWDRPVPWLRSRKGSIVQPPTPPTPEDRRSQRAQEMNHYEINQRWQELGVVLDDREQGAVYTPSIFEAIPLPSLDALVAHIRYAAGVELGVTLEYLAAAYSLNRRLAGTDLANDIRAAFAELMRVAFGEMKHMRAVNDLLRGLAERGFIQSFTPALQIAKELPAGAGNTRPLEFRRLTRATMADFIDIERPSASVDGLYSRILVTLRQIPNMPSSLTSIVEGIIADGTDHFDTFSFIQEWLRPHPESAYLLSLRPANDTTPEFQALQQGYQQLLITLYSGYEQGLPPGAPDIAAARDLMLQNPGGIQGGCEALVTAGFAVAFETPNDPRFSPIGRP